MHQSALFAYLAQTYHAQPEYLWAKFPEYAVFRAPNGKWFALYMRLSAAQLGLSGGLSADEHYCIVNLKTPTQNIAPLLLSPFIFPAYHMNKRHWISLSIEMLDTDFCQSLIDESYALVYSPKKTD